MPYLEELRRVGRVLLKKRERLRVLHPLTRSHPLHVTAAEAARVAERVGVVDDPAPRDRDGLEAAVRVPWEPRNILAMVPVRTNKNGLKTGTSSPWYPHESGRWVSSRGGK